MPCACQCLIERKTVLAPCTRHPSRRRAPARASVGGATAEHLSVLDESRYPDVATHYGPIFCRVRGRARDYARREPQFRAIAPRPVAAARKGANVRPQSERPCVGRKSTHTKSCLFRRWSPARRCLYREHFEMPSDTPGQFRRQSGQTDHRRK